MIKKIFLLSLLLATSGWSVTKYFAANGSTANTGLTADSPWPLSRFTTTYVADGDTCRFNSDYVFREATLTIPRNSLVLDAYGTGSRFKISAGRLLVGAGFEWHLSSNGTNEYYVTLTGGSNPSITARPMPIWVNDEALDTNSLGSLLDHQYNWGDNDGLGFNTIYLRLDAGDPDITGDTIITTKQSNALYAATKNNITVKHGIFENSSGAAVRFVTCDSPVFDSCEIKHSFRGMQLETVTNSLIKTCIVKNIFAASFEGVYYLNNAINNRIVNSLIYDCGGYGVLVGSGSSVTIIGCDILKTRLSGLRSTSILDCNLINSCVIGCGYSNQQPVIPASTGLINISHNCILDGGNYNNNMVLNCTDLGGNTFTYPKFVNTPYVGFVIPRLDDWTGVGSVQIFKTFTDSLFKYAPGANMSWNVSRTDVIPESDWSQIKSLSDAGWDIAVHTRGHIDCSPSDAYTIRYTGTGETCVMSITTDTLNRTGVITLNSSNDADDYTFNLSINDGTNYRLGDPARNVVGVLTTINNLDNYECSAIEESWYYVKSFCLQPITNQDIKTATYSGTVNLTTFYHEEFYMCAQDLMTKLDKTSVSMAYATTSANKDSIIPYITTYMPNIILSGFSVSPASSTLMKRINIYDMSCAGVSTLFAPSDSLRNLKAKSIASLMTFWGGALALLTHDLNSWKPDSLGIFAKTIQDMESRCRVGSQMDATQFIIQNGLKLNDRMYRVAQKDSSDFRLKSTSPCKNKGDKTAIAGIANLYTLDGIQLTDASGTVLVDSINIGAYGTLEEDLGCDSNLTKLDSSNVGAIQFILFDTLICDTGDIITQMTQDTTSTITNIDTAEDVNSIYEYRDTITNLTPSQDYFFRRIFTQDTGSSPLSDTTNWFMVTMKDTGDTSDPWYVPPEYTITLNVVGSGTVNQSPSGSTHDSGTVIHFTATPAQGWSFIGYTDSLVSTDSIDSLLLNNNKVVTATFTKDEIIPILLSSSPLSDTAGAMLYLIGSNLNLVDTVKLGDSILPIHLLSDAYDSLYTSTPENMPTGTYDIKIIWNTGRDSLEDAFTVIFDRFLIDSIVPRYSWADSSFKVYSSTWMDSSKAFCKINSVNLTCESFGTPKRWKVPSWVSGSPGLYWLKIGEFNGSDSTVSDSLRVRILKFGGAQ